jgi:hypothetical protein
MFWEELSARFDAEYAEWSKHPRTYQWRKHGVFAVWIYARRVPNRIRQIRCSTVYAWQRLTRGWDDRSIWSLDDSFTKQLGAQLIEMARVSHHVEPSVEELTLYGNALLAYSTHWYNEGEDFMERFEKLRQDAEEALTWVGANLGRLWT